jgi:SOS-response transcriptional repressor LexA
MTGIPLYNLPQRQREVLHYIIRHIDDAGQSPTLDEIALACNMHRQHAHKIIDALEKKGRISRTKGAARSITIVVTGGNK